MKSSEIEKEKVILAKKGKIIYTKLLNLLFLITLFFVNYFAISRNILLYGTSYQSDKQLKEKSGEEVIKIGVESHLIKYYEDSNAISTVEGLYKIYVVSNIKLCYEAYPYIYKEELDKYGYLEKKETVNAYDIESWESGFLEQFYLDYIIEKTNKEGNRIVSYTNETKYEYFIENVLDLSNSGKDYFVYDENNYKILPHFNLDIARYLFQYNIMGVNYSTLRNVDNEFYSYFKNVYQNALSILMEVEDYSISLSTYNSMYYKTNNFLCLTIVLTFIFSFLIIFLIVPLINKKHQNIVEIILKLIKLDQNKEIKIKYIFISLINDLILSLSIFFLFFLVIGGSTLINYTLIKIGVFTINSLHISIFNLFISLLNLIIRLIKKDSRALEEKIFKINYYEIF